MYLEVVSIPGFHQAESGRKCTSSIREVVRYSIGAHVDTEDRAALTNCNSADAGNEVEAWPVASMNLQRKKNIWNRFNC